MNNDKLAPMAWAVNDRSMTKLFSTEPTKDHRGYWRCVISSPYGTAPNYGHLIYATVQLPPDTPTPLYTLEQAREIITNEYNTKINKQC